MSGQVKRRRYGLTGKDSISWSRALDALTGDVFLLPEQFGAGPFRTEHHELYGAMVVGAVKTLVGESAATQAEWDEDKEWFENDGTKPLTFLWCCTLLDLNHIALRKVVVERYKVRPIKKRYYDNRREAQRARQKRYTAKRTPEQRAQAIARLKAWRAKQTPEALVEARRRNRERNKAWRAKHAIYQEAGPSGGSSA